MRYFNSFIIVFLLLFAVACDNDTNKIDEVVTNPDDKPVVENDEFITAGNSEDDRSYNDGGGEGDLGGEDGATEGDDAPSATREIVEADIYKVDGDILWVLNQYRGLIAIDISDPSALKILGRLSFKGLPDEMFVQDGRAFVLLTGFRQMETDSEEGYADASRMASKLLAIDIEDPKNLKMISSFEMEGTITDSRQVGDVIYVAATERRWYWYYCDDQEERGNDRISIMSINIANPKDITKVDEVNIDGLSYAMYVSSTNIFVADSSWDWSSDTVPDGDEFAIKWFDISDPTGKIVENKAFSTKGYLADRWKMHQIGDTFFAVGNTERWGNGTSLIESFDVSAPDTVTKLDSLAFMTGQQLYATRYEVDRLYAVTYERQDPLHVIDIADSSSLRELGQLEVPGWSTHIEVRGTKLLAVGIDDQDGWKVKVSMYNVDDPTKPAEMSSLSFGGGYYSQSEANEDWKAFKIYDDLGLILLPTMEYEERSYYWRPINKLNLIDFDMEAGLTKRGSIVSPSPVKRGVVAGDHIISVAERDVQIIDAKDRDKPVLLSSVQVASHVDHLTSCGSGICSVDNQYYSQPSTLVAYDMKTVDFPVSFRGEALPNGHYGTLLKSGDTGYFIGQTYYYYGYMDEGELDGDGDEKESYTGLQVYSFADATPKLVGNIKLINPVADEESYYYINSYSAVATDSGSIGMVKNNDGMYYYDGQECGDYRDGSYWVSRSDILLYDVSDKDKESAEPVVYKEKVRGLNYSVTLVPHEKSLWYTECEGRGVDDEKREKLACFAKEIVLDDPAKPKAGASLNIPGELVKISKDGNTFYSYYRMFRTSLEYTDDEGDYTYQSYYKTYLYILKRTDNKLSLVSAIPLRNYSFSNEEKSIYSYESYTLQDDAIFVTSNKTTYYRSTDECRYWYYSNRENEMGVTLYDALSGAEKGSWDISDGMRSVSVDGGGLLVALEDPENTYWGYKVSKDMSYISATGTKTELELTEPGYFSYAYGLSAVKVDNKLYISRDWDGIATVDVK